MAATWDRELVEMIGQALAEEAMSKGVAVVYVRCSILYILFC